MARILSSDHLAKYLKGGVYYDFLQYVKSDKELERLKQGLELLVSK